MDGGAPIQAWLQGITSDRLDAVWPEVEPLLERGLARAGDWDAFDVGRFLRAGDMQLWAAFEMGRIVAVCVTQIVAYPRRQVLQIAILAGDGWERWSGAGVEMLNDFARAHGCIALELIGRRGWWRRLKDWTGWRVVMRREVV